MPKGENKKRKGMDYEDKKDGAFLLPDKVRQKPLRLRKMPIETRSHIAVKQFKRYRVPITQEQRALQRTVYEDMPAPATLEQLQAQGKPAEAELVTPSVYPDLHKHAAFVRKQMQSGEGGASQIIFKYEQIRKKHAVFALVKESLKYSKLITQLLEDVEFYKKYPKVKADNEHVHVLMYEMLFGKGLDFAWPHSAVEAVVAEHQSFLKHLYQHANEDIDQWSFSALPRYARINVIKYSMKLALSYYIKEGFILKTDVKPAKYHKLKAMHFCIDPDIPDLLVFASGTNLSGKLVDNCDIIVQDKASCFSALALLPPDLTTKPTGVMDACAAPGNKTMHLGALLNYNRLDLKTYGVPIVAVEKDQKRFETLKTRCYNSYLRGLCINADFLSLDPSKFMQISHMLIDPSCSGSGIVSPERYASSGFRTRSKQIESKTTLAALPDDYDDLEYDEPNPDYNFEYDDTAESDKDENMASAVKENKTKLNKVESEDDDSDQNDEGDSDYGSENGSESGSSSESEGESEDEAEAEPEPDPESENKGENNTTTDQAKLKTKRKETHTKVLTAQQQIDQFSVYVIGDEKMQTRITNLRKFQISVLKHAFKFPSVQRLVYSTCSIFIEENERVVEEVLEQTPRFKLVKALPDWNHRGLEVFEGGSLCARASPEEDKATGFFVACFERCEPEPEQLFKTPTNNQNKQASSKKQKPKQSKPKNLIAPPPKNPTKPASNTPNKKKRRVNPVPILVSKQ